MGKKSMVPFHVVGFKCCHCGSYNTCRIKGPVNPTGALDNQPANGEGSNAANNNDQPEENGNMQELRDRLAQ
ncbi:hypothetical protein YQE_12447, partial [Dendroctonus ponderosae]